MKSEEENQKELSELDLEIQDHERYIQFLEKNLKEPNNDPHNEENTYKEIEKQKSQIKDVFNVKREEILSRLSEETRRKMLSRRINAIPVAEPQVVTKAMLEEEIENDIGNLEWIKQEKSEIEKFAKSSTSSKEDYCYKQWRFYDAKCRFSEMNKRIEDLKIKCTKMPDDPPHTGDVKNVSPKDKETLSKKK